MSEIIELTDTARLRIEHDPDAECPRGDWHMLTGFVKIQGRGDSRLMDVPAVHDEPIPIEEAHDRLAFWRTDNDEDAVERWARIFHDLHIEYDDEHGGYYDHVPPPPACIPDDVPPNLQKGDVDAQFDRYGFRVPVVVVSPYARKRFVSHVVHDHTSILRFIETRFDIPALTRRDANADPMLEFFDFADPPFVKPRSPAAWP